MKFFFLRTGSKVNLSGELIISIKAELLYRATNTIPENNPDWYHIGSNS